MNGAGDIENDTNELGTRTAYWLAAASNDPHFMLAGHKLRERGPRRKIIHLQEVNREQPQHH